MNEIDELLDQAGRRWRAAQPPAAAIEPASLTRTSGSGGRRVLVSFAAGAAGAAVVLAAAALASHFGIWRGTDERGLGTAPTESVASNAAATNGCAVTRPDPPFVAPSPYPAIAPPLYEADWYGSEALWTMLDRDGEVWSVRGQKTFWWTVEWAGMADDPEPGITVVGTRLDGPGTFTAGPATNAARDDFGQAMLVGVSIPTPGCWQITASYQDAVLSYVVLVTDG